MLQHFSDGVLLCLALFIWMAFCLMGAAVVYYMLELISMGVF